MSARGQVGSAGRRNASAIAVERAVEVLRVLASRGERSLTEIARELGVGASAVHRILTALRRQGLVEQDRASDAYRLTWRVVELAKTTRGTDLREAARGHMAELAGTTGETIPLHARSGFDRICVDQHASAHEVRYVCQVGGGHSLNVGASGRAILAALADNAFEDFLSAGELERFTEHTLTDPAALRMDVDRTRSRGYCHAEGDRIEGLTGISAPLFDGSGEVAGALSIAGPSFRCSQDRVEEWSVLLRRSAHEISLALGYRGRPFGEHATGATRALATPSGD